MGLPVTSVTSPAEGLWKFAGLIGTGSTNVIVLSLVSAAYPTFATTLLTMTMVEAAFRMGNTSVPLAPVIALSDGSLPPHLFQSRVVDRPTLDDVRTFVTAMVNECAITSARPLERPSGRSNSGRRVSWANVFVNQPARW